MHRKKLLVIVSVFSLLLLLYGCGENSVTSVSSLNTTVENDVLNDEGNIETDVQNENDTNEIIVEDEIVAEDEIVGENEAYSDDSIDIDLTKMGSEMIYATISQLYSDSDSYIGKTIRLRGNYYASFYEGTNQTYHYAVIQDATACCSQCMEFVWEDGSHVYPDEYPTENASIVITGVFDTYIEEDYLYCHLKDCSLVVE